MKFNPFTSVTMWGALGTAIAWVAQQPQINITTVATALFGVVTAFGGRNAIAKVS